MTLICTKAERRLATLVQETRQKIQSRTKGMKVKMLGGKYAGREALVDGVRLDEMNGQWMFCCWILRADGSGLLDTDGESRAYHNWMDFAPIVPEVANDD